MDTDLLVRVLRRRAAFARHDRWTPDRLAAHQAAALAYLRRHASSQSPFYSVHHAGLDRALLRDLPTVTKAQLMDNFDQVIAARGLTLEEVDAHLRALAEAGGDPGRPFRGRWWVAATAGTTGRRGVFVWDRWEWSTVLASYARATQWAGVRAGLARPVRMGVVSSRVPTHQSAVVGASLRSRTVPTLRLDARMPVGDLVAQLNDFAPRVLVGYASSLRPLALEQLAGRLRISPEAVMSASEILSSPAALEMERAWGSRPFDVYAATETAGISSPCLLGNRHLYEDLVIAEPVTDDGSPAAPGTAGARLLVTVLFSRTLPLIRYELSDRVTLSTSGCACGLPFRVLERVEGREQEVLTVRGTAGTVQLHPLFFHAALDDTDASQWQVILETDTLCVLVVPKGTGMDTESLRRDVETSLRDVGALIGVRVDVVSEIPRTALGKTPLILRAERG